MQRKRGSRQHENKENIQDIAYYEAETARLHKEFVEGNIEPHKVHKEKRTTSDNSRSINDQMRA